MSHAAADTRTLDSPWSPLRQPLFRSLWIAAVVSNIGTWMQNVGGVWLMATLSESPFLIALMQAASSLPFFLVALPAGVLADTFDRRRVMLVLLSWMAIAAALLGFLTLAGRVTPAWLLGLTFLLGMGNAIFTPSWQSALPEIAGRGELPKAVALSGVGYNIARVIGPSIGGFVVAWVGSGVNFLINAVSFLGVIRVIHGWQRVQAPSTLPGEHFFGAMRAGLRYARYAPLLQAVLARSAVFIFFASALWALLPVVAKHKLGLGSAGYGVLVGCLGSGSLIGAAVLPRMSRTMTLDARLAIAGACFGVATIALASLSSMWILCPMMVVAGFGWLTTMVSVNVATQSVAPAWVLARALGLYVLVTQGGLAAGSFIWGALAAQTGESPALGLAGLGLLVGLGAVYRWPLSRIREIDTTPVSEWREPSVARELHPDEGPVLVTVEYRIEPSRYEEFREAMKDMRRLRCRDGAIRWELFQDLGDAGRVLESFVVESWAEHLRQHARVTRDDLALRKRIRSFHLGEKAPEVSHLIHGLS